MFNNLTMKLTYKFGQANVDFLNVQFCVDDDDFVYSDLFRKTTATNTLLHETSFHPRCLSQSIPVEQFFRIRRLCFTEVGNGTQYIQSTYSCAIKEKEAIY